MLTYLDESYDKNTIIIGALFMPTDSEKTYFHKRFLKIKKDNKFIDKNGSVKEIKYSKLNSRKTLNIAKLSVDLFANSYKSFFRAGVIQYTQNDLEHMRKLSNTPLSLKVKKAMMYTKIVELLIKNNYSSRKVSDGVLLMDYLTRCKGDNFDSIISDKLMNQKQKYLKHFDYIDSKKESTHTIQICDLLLGSIRNEIFATKNKYKKEFSEYVKNKFRLPSISKWKGINQARAESKYPKFTIRIYGVPYKCSSEVK